MERDLHCVIKRWLSLATKTQHVFIRKGIKKPYSMILGYCLRT